MPKRVLVLGATSRVGSHFVAHPPQGWEVESAGRSDPRKLGLSVATHTALDLSDESAVRSQVSEERFDAVVNFAARTDVDACELERPFQAPAPDSSGAAGSAWRINAELPRWLAEESAARGTFLVHLSTDFVFDGTAGPYPEATPPSSFSPTIGWYGYTKGVGEAAVYRSKGPRAIVRIAFPYGTQLQGRTDLALTLLARRREGKLYPLYTDQRITPTWVPDVTDALGAILSRSSGKVYHVASPEVTTPFEFARTLFTAAGWRAEDLPSSSLAAQAPAPGRAPRPLSGGLKVSEVHRLDLRPVSFREGARRLVDGFGADEPSRARAGSASTA